MSVGYKMACRHTLYLVYLAIYTEQESDVKYIIYCTHLITIGLWWLYGVPRIPRLLLSIWTSAGGGFQGNWRVYGRWTTNRWLLGADRSFAPHAPIVGGCRRAQALDSLTLRHLNKHITAKHSSSHKQTAV